MPDEQDILGQQTPPSDPPGGTPPPADPPAPGAAPEEPKLYGGKYATIDEFEAAFHDLHSTVGRQGRELGFFRRQVDPATAAQFRTLADDESINPESFQPAHPAPSAPAAPAPTPEQQLEAEQMAIIQRCQPYAEGYIQFYKDLGFAEAEAEKRGWTQAFQEDARIKTMAMEIAKQELLPLQKLLDQHVVMPSVYQPVINSMLTEQAISGVDANALAAKVQEVVPAPVWQGMTADQQRRTVASLTLAMGGDILWGQQAPPPSSTPPAQQPPAVQVPNGSRQQTPADSPEVMAMAQSIKAQFGERITDEQAIKRARDHYKKAG